MPHTICQQDHDGFEKLGWFAHCVPGGDNTPCGGFNYHTHGLETSWNHPNIQIVLPLRFETAHHIVADIVERIKGGERFEPNKDYADIVGGGYMVRFIEAKECGRSVLRLVIPDKNGVYEGDFAEQFIMLDSNEGVPEDEKVYQED